MSELLSKEDMSVLPSGKQETSTRDVQTVVNSIARTFEEAMNAGDLASLRRARIDDPVCGPFFRVSAMFLEPHGFVPVDGPAREFAERCWTSLLSAMAHTVGLHRPGSPVGSALAEAGYSEQRFVRLLRASDKALHDEMMTASRYLAVKAIPFDWADLVRLMLSDSFAHAETVRRQIARSYYRVVEQSNNQ